MQPKYTVKNFTKDNIYWLKEMLPVSIGGQNVLTSGYYTYSFIDSLDSGWTNMDGLGGSSGMSDFQIGVATSRTLMMLSGASIFLSTYGEVKQGLIHTVPTSGTIAPATHPYPDILTTPENYILYTSKKNVGVGYYFKATAASSTSLTVDGTDFTALGISSSAGSNKIWNITKAKEYTITSVSGTGNITLNFAEQTPTPQINDYFIVFKDDKFDLLAGSAAYPQFTGQKDAQYWVRQIELWDDRYYILNGNYLAMIDATLTTLTEDYQQFPKGVEARCMAVNNDLMLIGAVNRGNSGMLLVYDGYSSYFKSIINIGTIPVSVVAYQGGWLVILKNGKIIWTDGIAYKVLTTLPDFDIRTNTLDMCANGMILKDERLFLHITDYTNQSLRRSTGIFIYDIEKNIWAISPLTGAYGYIGAYGSAGNSALYSLYPTVEEQNIYYTETNTLGSMVAGGNGQNKEMFLVITLPKKERISAVELNLAQQHNRDILVLDADDETTVSVSSWDGRGSLFSKNTAKDTSTTVKIYPDTVGSDVFVGQEIFVLGGQTTNTKNIYEYTYITAINDKGTATESWDTLPALSNNFAEAQDIFLYGFKYGETRTINYSDINNNTTFNVKDFYGDKLYLHIRINGYLDLHGINIY